MGAVIIGRNEGERLRNCIASVSKVLERIVYVDSGSSDNSLENAQLAGIEVIDLDRNSPFTAARARNEGADRLLHVTPEIEFIQFIDGDCILMDDWLSKAVMFLENEKNYGVVCGRRSEIHPGKTVYNLLCDIEWDTPIGDADSCGGDALVRVNAYHQVKGYSKDLIAGEDPEMCFRMRQAGWKIARIDVPMTLHDAAMDSFEQWWNRTRRSGFAYMSNAHLHGAGRDRFCVREVISIVSWTGLIPALIVAAILYSPVFLLGFMVFPLQIIRLSVRGPRAGSTNLLWAASIYAGKIPQLLGVMQYWLNYLGGRKATLIEYK